MVDYRAGRSRDFKKGIDADKGRRNRNDTCIQLRKNKREEGLQKRRAMANAQPDMTSSFSMQPSNINEAPKKSFGVTDIPDLAKTFLKAGATKEEIHQAVIGFRKMLSVERNPPVRQVIEANMLTKFVQLLSHEDKSIQFEAAWALTNVASTEYTRTVAEHGAIPYLVQLLLSESADVREQSAWCLGNIAGDATDLRDLVLDAGAIEPMLKNVASPATKSLLSNVIWALSNFCRGKPQPELSQVAPAIPYLAKIVSERHETALQDACWALSYLSDGSDTRIESVMKTGIVKSLVELLASDQATIVTPALRILGNFVSGNDSQTQRVIDAGVLNYIANLLSHKKRSIRKEACWLISNIAAGNHGQITSLVRMPSVISLVLAHVANAEWEVRKEATWVVSNIATGGLNGHVHGLVELGAIHALCSVIDVADPKILLVVLDAIECILRAGKNDGRDYIGFVDECDGLDKIEKLQEHANNNVYEKAVFIIESYFGVDDEEDENLVPTVNGDTFSFGLPVSKATEHEHGDAPQQQPLQPFNFAFAS